jgi:hypothetical protein
MSGLGGFAQEHGASGPATDPRVGLKAGVTDAGEAAWHMEKIASLPKPKGFFDPNLPLGMPTPAEEEPKAEEKKD